MEFVRSIKNRSPLEELCKKALKECDAVWAAVAYVTQESLLIEPCYEKKIPLKLWARYDYSIPTKTDILQQFIDWKSPNYECKLVPDIFHPKIIWWKGYGAYIGSANLTYKAWNQNYEAGVFLSEYDLDEQNMRHQLTEYFDEIDASSHSITQEKINEMVDYENSGALAAIEAAKRNFDELRDNDAGFPKLDSLAASDQQRNKRNKRKEAFLKEWRETLEHLRAIAHIVSQDKYRPDWFDSEAIGGVQADQFLHAYYYKQVMDGNKAGHHKLHEENKSNPEAAREKAMLWWKNTYTPSTTGYSEKIMIEEWAPYLRRKLKKDTILTLSEEEVKGVLEKVHAFKNYAERNASNKDLGLSPDVRHTAQERLNRLSEKVFREKAQNGFSFLKMLNELLYGGPDSKLAERLYEAAWNPEKRIPHFGIGSLGEIVGWALPDVMPPRNGRTSKALFALGYNVTLYSE